SRRRHTRCYRDWSSDVCSSDLELLVRLGAVDAARAVTAIGRRMLRFPVHPRLARMIAEAERRGVGPDGCVLAALAGERDIASGQIGRASWRGGGEGEGGRGCVT